MDLLPAASLPCVCPSCAELHPPVPPRVLRVVEAVSVLEDWTVLPIGLDNVLSPNERRLLRLLVLHYPAVVPRQSLGRAICARGTSVQVHNTVAVQIGRLRKKLLPYRLNPRALDRLGYRLEIIEAAPPLAHASYAA